MNDPSYYLNLAGASSPGSRASAGRRARLLACMSERLPGLFQQYTELILSGDQADKARARALLHIATAVCGVDNPSAGTMGSESSAPQRENLADECRKKGGIWDPVSQTCKKISNVQTNVGPGPRSGSSWTMI